MAKKKRFLKNEPGYEQIMHIKPHILVLLLRKSVGKLIEYINLHDFSSIARDDIIEQKYLLSKCRPEVLNIFTSITVRIEQLCFQRAWDTDRVIVLNDTAAGTTFRCYHTVDDENIHKFASIDGKKVFTNLEARMFKKILCSLLHMHENRESVLSDIREQAEIQSIFDMYQPRRHS